MHAARELLGSLELPTLRDAVLASVVANLLDYGAPNLRESLSVGDFTNLDRLPLWVDDFGRMVDALGRARRLVWLADNSGEVLFDLVVLERLRALNPSCAVALVGKGGPMLNDVTADELTALELPANCRVLSTGSNSFGLPEDEVSDELRRALLEADVVIAKGHAYLEFWVHYAMPTLFHLAYTKSSGARRAPARDSRRRPAGDVGGTLCRGQATVRCDGTGGAGVKRRRASPPPIDPRRIHTVPLGRRPSKVAAAALGKPVRRGLSVRAWLDGLPDILAARDLRDAAARIARATRAGKPVVLGMGAHGIKVGLGPLIVDLIERERVAAVAMNGACLVHDFELAWGGRTSEDVGPGLDRGLFGMARETGEFLNRATTEGVAAGMGLGRAIGDAIEAARLPHRRTSILAAAARAGIPATVHVAIGTDIIHMHPDADGAAIGAGSLRDFHLLASVVGGLDRGVYLNLGSAVILPEVFVKALNLARNVGRPVRRLTTIDMDFIRHYRPGVNVVARPTATGGRGIRLTGHHEIMFPLLWAAVEEALR